MIPAEICVQSWTYVFWDNKNIYYKKKWTYEEFLSGSNGYSNDRLAMNENYCLVTSALGG